MKHQRPRNTTRRVNPRQCHNWESGVFFSHSTDMPSSINASFQSSSPLLRQQKPLYYKRLPGSGNALPRLTADATDNAHQNDPNPTDPLKSTVSLLPRNALWYTHIRLPPFSLSPIPPRTRLNTTKKSIVIYRALHESKQNLPLSHLFPVYPSISNPMSLPIQNFAPLFSDLVTHQVFLSEYKISSCANARQRRTPATTTPTMPPDRLCLESWLRESLPHLRTRDDDDEADADPQILRSSSHISVLHCQQNKKENPQDPNYPST